MIVLKVLGGICVLVMLVFFGVVNHDRRRARRVQRNYRRLEIEWDAPRHILQDSDAAHQNAQEAIDRAG